jgi:hypothetical protein
MTMPTMPTMPTTRPTRRDDADRIEAVGHDRRRKQPW